MRSLTVLLCALPPTVLAATALAQGLAPAWYVDTPKDAPAMLVYGEPAAPILGFACERRSGQVMTRLMLQRTIADHRVGAVWVDAAGIAGPWPASVAFTSGEAATTLRGQAEAGQTASGTAVSTEISTAAPVIKAFGKSGVISLTAMSETLTPPAAKPQMVRKFLGACR